MVFFKVRWIRRLLRRTMPNMTESIAEKWHTRLTFLYFFLAWNTFGAVIYASKNGKFDYAQYYGLKTEQEAAQSKAVRTMEFLGIKKARIITVDGLTKVRDEEYENTLVDEQMEDLKEEMETFQNQIRNKQ